MALRALYSSNSSQRDFSEVAAVWAASASGTPRLIKSRQSLGQAFEVGPFAGERAGPLGRRAMTWDDLFRWNPGKLVNGRKPAANTAINDREVLYEQQVAGE